MHFTDEAMRLLVAYCWPGNVRELENLIERLCVMEEGPELGIEHLPQEIRNSSSPVVSCNTADEEESSSVCLSIPEVERRTIFSAMAQTGGNRQKTADILQISTRTLRNKLNQYRRENLMPVQA